MAKLVYGILVFLFTVAGLCGGTRLCPRGYHCHRERGVQYCKCVSDLEIFRPPRLFDEYATHNSKQRGPVVVRKANAGISCDLNNPCPSGYFCEYSYDMCFPVYCDNAHVCPIGYHCDKQRGDLCWPDNRSEGYHQVLSYKRHYLRHLKLQITYRNVRKYQNLADQGLSQDGELLLLDMPNNRPRHCIRVRPCKEGFTCFRLHCIRNSLVDFHFNHRHRSLKNQRLSLKPLYFLSGSRPVQLFDPCLYENDVLGHSLNFQPKPCCPKCPPGKVCFRGPVPTCIDAPFVKHPLSIGRRNHGFLTDLNLLY